MFCGVQGGNLETFPQTGPVFTGVHGAEHNIWFCRDLFHIRKLFSSFMNKGGVQGLLFPSVK